MPLKTNYKWKQLV